jgi:hypothetical protein
MALGNAAFSRRNSFAELGAELKNGFAQRFGGFQGTPQVAGLFGTDTNDMVKNVSEIDTKTINNMISSALDQKLNETPSAPEPPATPTYSKPEIPKFGMGNISLFNSLQESYSNFKIPTPLKEEAPVINAAAALNTTGEGVNAGILNSDLLTSLAGLANNPFISGGFDISGARLGPNLYTPQPLAEPEVKQELERMPEPLAEPEVKQELETTPIIPVQTTEPEVEPPSEQPIITTQFNDTVTQLFDTINENKDQNDEILESIDVIGRDVGEQNDEILESVDVIGEEDGMKKDESSCCTRLSKDIDGLRTDIEENDNSADIWERFKRLYVDFYTGGKDASSVLRDVNRGENSYYGEEPPRSDRGSYDDLRTGDNELESIDVIGSPQLSVRDNNMTSDTEEILRGVSEKEELLANNNNDDMSKVKEIIAPLILNNNKTITARDMGESRTGRVFSDDNTFNRLSSADSNHPQYTGFR